MEAFYLPFKYVYTNHNGVNIPIIVYIAKEDNNIKGVLPSNVTIEGHIQTLYDYITETSDRNAVMQGDYHILFLRDMRNQLVSNIWIHCNAFKWLSNSGPRSLCFCYQGNRQGGINKINPYDLDMYFGFCFGDDLVVLAAEEMHRRRYA